MTTGEIRDAVEIELEGDRHGCCCEHVVDQFQAMPLLDEAPGEVRYGLVRDKYYSCPHREVTQLEIYMDQLRRGA